MKILVLGGTGLISTGIVQLSLAAGHDVTVLSRSRRGLPPDGVDLLVGDRDDPDALRRAADLGFDAVVDMICFEPGQAETAVTAFGGRVAQYLMCSTVDVYTKGGRGFPIDESAGREPSASFPYAHGKAASERVLEAAADAGAFALTLLRPAATYLDSAVAPVGRDFGAYVERLRDGKPIILHGDGSSIWVSTHRDDVAAGFVGAIGNERAFGRAYNLAGTELLTWNAYWAEVAAALGVADPRVIHIPTDALQRLSPSQAEWCVENFQYNNIYDSSAAAADLGYSYRTSWAEGVAAFPFEAESVDPRLAADLDSIAEAWRDATGIGRGEPLV